MVATAGPSRDGGVSPELEKMAAGKLDGVREDGGSREREGKKAAATVTRICRITGKPYRPWQGGGRQRG